MVKTSGCLRELILKGASALKDKIKTIYTTQVLGGKEQASQESDHPPAGTHSPIPRRSDPACALDVLSGRRGISMHIMHIHKVRMLVYDVFWGSIHSSSCSA